MILDRLKPLYPYLGFLLGLVGLIGSTWILFVVWSGVRVTSALAEARPALLGAWLLYLLAAFFNRNLRLSIVLGLIFLTVPLFLAGGFHSVNDTQVHLMRLDRSFPPSHSSVVIAVSFKLSSPSGYLPVTFTNPVVWVIVRQSLVGPDTSDISSPDYSMNSGEFYPPLGSITYQISWSSTDSRIVSAMNQTATVVGVGFDSPIVSSGSYEESIESVDLVCWDWVTGKSFTFQSAPCS